MKTKFCKHCGKSINKEAIICVKCGLQVEELKASEIPNIVINNNSNNRNSDLYGHRGKIIRKRNKWIALALCIFLGFLGGHKFYEEKIGRGILYIFTGGLLGFGIIYDIISLLCKPNPYYA